MPYHAGGLWGDRALAALVDGGRDAAIGAIAAAVVVGFGVVFVGVALDYCKGLDGRVLYLLNNLFEHLVVDPERRPFWI